MKVRVNLVAMRRVEWSKVIEVPDDTVQYDLDSLAEQLSKDVSSDEYWEDFEYWDEQAPSVEKVPDDEELEAEAVLEADDHWKITDVTDTR